MRKLRTKSKKSKLSKTNKRTNLVLTNLNISSDEEIANKMYYNGLNTKIEIPKEYVIKPELKVQRSFSSVYRSVENDSILGILKKIVKHKAV